METSLAELAHQHSFRIDESTGIGGARRYAQRLAAALEFDETTIGELAIVVTEAATNMLRHAGGGELLLRPLFDGTRSGIEILALDKGPGISDLAHSMIDGVSTAGTAGSGLGAMRRLATEFDVYSASGKGSVVYLTIWDGAEPAAAAGIATTVQFGVVSLPKAGEHACGDGWAVVGTDRVVLAVADGLGHGPDAANAARAVLDVLRDRAELPPAQLIGLAHQRARATRGAALAFAAWHGDDKAPLRFAGVGNIAACVQSDIERRQQLISHNGIVGHNMRKVQELAPSIDESPLLLVMHSDGLSSQWDPVAYPGLFTRHPALIAAVLYRDFNRGTDDVTVLAARLVRRPSNDYR